MHMKNNKESNEIAFIRELMAGKTEEEIQEAEENFRNYLMLVKRIALRVEEDEKLGISRPETTTKFNEDDYEMTFENGKLVLGPKEK
ncbi:MAG: hypothetical protein JWM20_651 [Patescibacteria group bacterium]|nr:hypothetical protein [Patescibacteria group bacterium]